MIRKTLSLILLAAPLLSAANLKISPNSTVRVAIEDEVEANYTTTHLYIDEVAGDSIPITIFFDPGTTGVEFAEVFTNLNRRDRADDDANSDGIEDGILPPDGNSIPAGNDANYFKAHTMALVNGGYQITLAANKTGAYRLTARFRLTGDAEGTYRYYNSTDGGGKRDHAIVVSPKSARDIQLYEVNPLTVNATGTLPSQRGTFADLAGGVSGAPRFNLNYVKSLGCNMLWFQPIHPNGIDGRQNDPATGQPFEVGSPYAVKNFFEVMPLMASGFEPGSTPATNDTPAGRAQALAEFQSFSAAADTAGVGVMLDAPFNHTSHDTELGALGQQLFGNGGTNASSEMRNTEARFFSRDNAYDLRASSSGNIAIAPDRFAEFQFADTYDVFYGRYAALVSGSTGGFNSEADWFDYTIGDENTAGVGHFDTITQKVWRYFAEYTLHWLTQTGYPANPTGAAIDSDVGIDALRADFGQGLPPQAWEYIINKTRARKWNFVFMAESLDGGAVTYRSGRHFDILNENIVFPLHAAQNTTDFRNIHESRRNAYGQALVLLNTSSHDEDHYQDPWHALIRYAANSSIDGVPLIFPGQELGLSGAVVPPGDSQSGITPFGYDRYETNFGKGIPHFKKYNSLMPLWLKTTPGDPSYNYGISQLSKVYEGIGQARKFSRALRSSNRYFLDLNDTTTQGQIFSVAKFENRNAPPNLSDVVLAFVNLDRNANPTTIGTNKFNVNIDADTNGTNDFGIKPARNYNVKNIAAYLGTDPTRRDNFLIPGGISGTNLLGQGLFVSLNRVPTTDGEWSTAPYEAQYLKLYDVTPPPAPDTPVSAGAYVIGTSATFTWGTSAFTNDDVADFFTVNGTVQATTASITLTGNIGDNLTAAVTATSTAGFTSPSSLTSTPVKLISAGGDEDGDGFSNAEENTAGTNALDGASYFRITSFAGSEGGVSVTVDGVLGKNYRLWTSTSLQADEWVQVGDPKPGTGNPLIFTHTPGSGELKRFYRIGVE